MTTHHTFTGGLRIVDAHLCIHVVGTIWYAGVDPAVQVGDYVTVPAQDITGDFIVVTSEGRPGVFIPRLSAPVEAPVAAALMAASARANGKSALTPDQAQAMAGHVLSPREKGRAESRLTCRLFYFPKVDALSDKATRRAIQRKLEACRLDNAVLTLDQAELIAVQLMVDHAEAARRLHTLHDLLASLRQAGRSRAFADPAPASAGSPAPVPTGGAPAPARPTGSPAHSFGPIRLDQTGPQGRWQAFHSRWS